MPRKGTTESIREHFDKGSGSVMGASILMLAIILTLFTVDKLDKPGLGVGLGVVFALFVGSFLKPIVKLAWEGFKSIMPVIFVSWFLILVIIGAWYLCYYLISGQLGSSTGNSKILDVPTLLVAIGAAMTGWYVSFHLTRRSHRTSHAVSLVLGSRTNSEFQKHSTAVRQYLPTENCVKAIDPALFEIDALKKCCREYFDKKDAPSLERLKVARSVEGLRYLLNYYEFMAVGIKLGDIEESIVYETISAHVVNVYDRSKTLRDWQIAKSGGNQILCFEHLDELVKRWRSLLEDDERDMKKKIDSRNG